MRLALTVSRAITREPIAAWIGDVEHLARDLLAQPLDERPPARVRRVAMDDQRERVDRLAADEDVHADELARAEADEVVVEARVAARARLQLVVVVEDDLGERQLVDEQDALAPTRYSMWSKRPRRSLFSSITAPTYSFGTMIDALMYGSSTSLDLVAACRPGCAPRPPRRSAS